MHLVDKATRLGGNAMHLFKTWRNEPIQEHVQEVLRRVAADPGIHVYLNSQVSQVTE